MTKLGYFLVLLLLAEGAATATSAGASSNSAGPRAAGVAPSSSLVHDQHFEHKEAAAATSVGVTLTSEDVVVLLLDNKNAPSSAATPRTSSRTSPSGDGGGLVLETAAGRGVVSTDGQQQQSSSTSTTSNMTMAKNKRKFFTTTSAGGGGRGRVRGATSSRTQNEHPADDTVLRTSRDLNELGEGQLLRQKKKQERKTAAKKKKVDKKGGSSCSKSANKKGNNIVELSTTADICGKDLDRPNTKYILVNDIICGKDGPNVSRGASLDCQGYTIIQDPSTIVPHVGIQIFAADGESALVKNCKVEGFTKSDYSVEGAGTVVLADSKSNKSKGAGLSVLGGSTGKFQIVDFEAKESGSQGIAVDQRFSGTINFQNPKIEDSTDQGILIEGDGIINIHKPDISSSGLNDMDGNSRSGLRIREPSSATVTVVDPSIHDNTNFGIFNTGGGNLFVQGGTIEKNRAGIVNDQAKPGSVHIVGVTISENDEDGFEERGANIASEVKIVASIIEKNGNDGVRVSNRGAMVSIQCCSIDKNDEFGVEVVRVGKLSIKDSSVTSSGSINLTIENNTPNNGAVFLSSSQFCDAEGGNEVDIRDQRTGGNRFNVEDLATTTCDETRGLGNNIQCGFSCSESCPLGVPEYCEFLSTQTCYN